MKNFSSKSTHKKMKGKTGGRYSQYIYLINDFHPKYKKYNINIIIYTTYI